jgi:hypothetical protein
MEHSIASERSSDEMEHQYRSCQDSISARTLPNALRPGVSKQCTYGARTGSNILPRRDHTPTRTPFFNRTYNHTDSETPNHKLRATSPAAATNRKQAPENKYGNRTCLFGGPAGFSNCSYIPYFRRQLHSDIFDIVFTGNLGSGKRKLRQPQAENYQPSGSN